jgi:hypothetical protein
VEGPECRGSRRLEAAAAPTGSMQQGRSSSCSSRGQGPGQQGLVQAAACQQWVVSLQEPFQDSQQEQQQLPVSIRAKGVVQKWQQ